MPAETQQLTFAEHIQELRKRLMWSLLFVAIGAGIGYALHAKILKILQQPLNDGLYYTAPTGAFSFVIKVCVVFGLIVALPVVVYQVFAFFGPLLPKKTKKAIVAYVLVSVLLAAAGIAFAYFISLPAALHFLTNFGSDGTNIQAIITADEYFNFVLAYIAGFAVLFQLPLIISFINKVTPLKPSQLLGGTRYVVLGSFVIAAVITPTPDPLNQALMAGPIILLYFLSVLAVAAAGKLTARSRNKPAVPASVLADIDALLAEDEAKPQAAVPQPAPLQATSPPVVRQTAIQPTATPRPAAHRRLTTDMVTLPRAHAPLAPVARSPQPAQTRSAPPQPRTRQIVRAGLISDFIPASD
jgi:sec-independent protein translocase protein TatC